MAFELFLQQGIEFHNQGFFDQAEAMYKKALSLSPQAHFVLNLLGLVAQSKGLDVLAVDYFYQALKYQPYSQEYNFSVGLSLENLGKYNQAVDAYQKASGVKEALNNIGNIYKLQGNLEKAKEYYQKALGLDADYDEAKANLAFAYMNKELLKTYADNPLAQYFLGLMYFEEENFEEAINHLQKAKNLNTYIDYVPFLMGQVYFKQKDYGSAQTFFYQAISLNPNNLQALLFLADIDTVLKNFAEAQMKYKQVLDYEPDNINARINYANMLYLAGQKALSLEEYRKVIAINPNIAEVSNNLGVILKEQKDYEEALGLFFNALALNPQLEETGINLVETLVLYSKIYKKNAILMAQNWLKTYPDNVFAKHLSACFEGKKPENDNEYNQKIFDYFSANYEEVLAKIDYKLPQKVCQIFGTLYGKILDLGCGTGLLGSLIKNNDNYLIGVDLSEKMLAVAEDKKVYDELICQSALSYLKHNHDFDYVFALDVFCYIADLSLILPYFLDKKFLFSVELDDAVNDYAIEPSGRYKHSQSYIKNLLGNIDHKTQEVVLRTEGGIDVKGMIFYRL